MTNSVNRLIFSLGGRVSIGNLIFLVSSSFLITLRRLNIRVSGVILGTIPEVLMTKTKVQLVGESTESSKKRTEKTKDSETYVPTFASTPEGFKASIVEALHLSATKQFLH